MKQTVLALAFVAIAIASCKNQTEAPVVEENTVIATEQTTPVVDNISKLVGTWRLPEGNKNYVLPDFQLKEDGTVVNVDDKVTMSFKKWKVVDNTLVLEGDGAVSTEIGVFPFYAIEDHVLTLDVEGVVEEYIKQ
ncbi:lipocalin family protein [Myroides sp. M-43]|uniref:lipocalin family protein n=1 Tax=Myroides oncorhynchi TaxID=2893756 RepID=UPI001E4EDB6C|nr:lipocalin family protein [Myroides oncorhynchi]MCC9042202.1 lipocalin family protein [Myroides oncorhynchi]